IARCALAQGQDEQALTHAAAAAQGLAAHCSGELDLVEEALVFLEGLHREGGRTAEADAVAAQRARRASEIAAHAEATRNDDLVRVLMELDALVGLDDLKAAVRTLANFLRVQVLREQGGRPRAQLVQHLVFSGPPGTGKTTVARLMGRIYQAVGLLEKGHVVEVGRGDLVAGFAGQTAIKTQQVIESALDGILFIDEAYSLFEGPAGSSYGPEAVATLIRAMEDQRDRLVVIIAGYPEPLTGLLRSNPGLSSRFTTSMTFAPYSATELAEIFCRLAAADQYDVADDAREHLVELCEALLATADEHFGNARAVRNVYKDSLTQHADRIIAQDRLREPALSTLTVEDLLWEDRPEGVLPGRFLRRRTFPSG
ncbi:MAG: ATPase of the class, partial [Solirubrobacterales bacterium]|nr:ATPase of the class [Solirubrobacterales bacterium]